MACMELHGAGRPPLKPPPPTHIHAHPTQPKKKEEKAYLRDKGQVEEPLDDPAAEKLRRQRWVWV